MVIIVGSLRTASRFFGSDGFELWHSTPGFAIGIGKSPRSDSSVTDEGVTRSPFLLVPKKPPTSVRGGLQKSRTILKNQEVLFQANQKA